MTVELIVAWFHNPQIPGTHHTSLEGIFARQYAKWAQYVDKATFVDSNWGITQLPGTIIPRPGNSHWASLKEMSEKSNADVLLFMDQDMLVVDPTVISLMRKYMENGADVITILDSSQEEIFPANSQRRGRSRFCPYLCMIRRSLVIEAGYDFDPDSSHDTMGLMTESIIKRHPDLRLIELPDNRFSVYLREGVISANTNLDGPGFSWSEPIDEDPDFGYYHVRNATLGLEIIEEFYCNKESYLRRKAASPDWEVFRSIAWWWLFDEVLGNTKEMERISVVLDDFNLPHSLWLSYIDSIKSQMSIPHLLLE